MSENQEPRGERDVVHALTRREMAQNVETCTPISCPFFAYRGVLLLRSDSVLGFHHSPVNLHTRSCADMGGVQLSWLRHHPGTKSREVGSGSGPFHSLRLLEEELELETIFISAKCDYIFQSRIVSSASSDITHLKGVQRASRRLGLVCSKICWHS